MNIVTKERRWLGVIVAAGLTFSLLWSSIPQADAVEDPAPEVITLEPAVAISKEKRAIVKTVMKAKAQRAYQALNLERHSKMDLEKFDGKAEQGPAAHVRPGDVLSLEATGYDASVYCTGDGDGYTASMTRFRPGVAAVDPRFIPMGSILYVKGYGYARAEDIGGAIKGMKIDLTFNKRADADAWGRQYDIQVVVLAVPKLVNGKIVYPELRDAI